MTASPRTDLPVCWPSTSSAEPDLLRAMLKTVIDGDSQVAQWLLLPGLAARATSSGGAGADHGGRDLLPAGGSRPGGWTSWSRL